MRTWNLIVRFFISLLLILFLLWKIDFQPVFELLKDISILGIILSFLFYLLTYVIITSRWYFILKYQGLDVHFPKLFSLYMVGFFFNNFVPSGIGGDVFRCIYISRGTKKGELFTASVITERLLGLIATLLIAIIFIPFSEFPSNIKYSVLLLSIGLIIVILLPILPYTNIIFRKICRIIPGNKIRNFTEQTIHSLSLFKSEALLYGFVFSILYQTGLITFFYFVGLSLGLNVSIINYLAFLPIVWIIGLIPISINAIGIREAGFAGMFAALGLDSSIGFSNSLIGFVISVIASLPGGIFFILMGKGKDETG